MRRRLTVAPQNWRKTHFFLAELSMAGYSVEVFCPDPANPFPDLAV
jgi:hypothetical protein